MTLLVVDDPELAAGISRLRGEWAERSGGELIIQQQTAQELLGGDELTPDLVVYPSRYLGTLVDRAWLRPVRKSLLRDKELNLKDIFTLIRDRVMRYGGEIFGLSLGEPPLMLAWEGNVPVEMKGGLSLTWSQCDRLGGGRSRAATLNKLKNPLAVELIVRAVGYFALRGDADFLFDAQTMEPRLLEPPFVRALRELLLLDMKAFEKKKEEARKNFPPALLSWPTAIPKDANSETAAPEEGEGKTTVHLFAIPHVDEAYDRGLETWRTAEEVRVSPTFLGFSGRMVSVSRASRNAVSAFKLLKWLARGDTATQVSSQSNATIWFRESQASLFAKWFQGRNISDGTSLTVTKLLSSENAYLLPRIPGIDEYLKSLNEAIAGARLGDLGEEEVLHVATRSWQAISERYGTQSQREAYRKHLGLDDQIPMPEDR